MLNFELKFKIMDNIFQDIGNKQTLSQKIERTIENGIREKKLPVGSKLPTEHEMCKAFGVSRTALREALRRFAKKSWTNWETHPGCRCFARANR